MQVTPKRSCRHRLTIQPRKAEFRPPIQKAKTIKSNNQKERSWGSQNKSTKEQRDRGGQRREWTRAEIRRRGEKWDDRKSSLDVAKVETGAAKKKREEGRDGLLGK